MSWITLVWGKWLPSTISMFLQRKTLEIVVSWVSGFQTETVHSKMCPSWQRHHPISWHWNPLNVPIQCWRVCRNAHSFKHAWMCFHCHTWYQNNTNKKLIRACDYHYIYAGNVKEYAEMLIALSMLLFWCPIATHSVRTTWTNYLIRECDYVKPNGDHCFCQTTHSTKNNGHTHYVTNHSALFEKPKNIFKAMSIWHWPLHWL